MLNKKFLRLILTALASAAASGAFSQNVCKNVTLTVDNVVFDKGCGNRPQWDYVESPGSSYMEFILDNGFMARKHLDKYPGEDFASCMITMIARYPKGCTFSPSYVGFYGNSQISKGHSGRVGLTLVDTHNTENRLDFFTKKMTNTNKNFAIKADLTKGDSQGFWAPCKGEAWLTYSLVARIEDQDETKRGRFLSTITVSEGTQVYRNTATLGFKECNPDN